MYLTENVNYNNNPPPPYFSIFSQIMFKVNGNAMFLSPLS